MKSNIFIRRIIQLFFENDLEYDTDVKTWSIYDDSFQDFMDNNIQNMEHVAMKKFSGMFTSALDYHQDGSIYIEYSDKSGNGGWIKIHLYGPDVVYSYD